MPSIEPDVFPQGPDFWRIAEPEAPSGHLRTDEQEASAPQQESESQQQNIYHVYMVKEPSRKHEAGPAIWQEEDELEPAEKTPHASSLRKPHYRILFPLMLVVLVVVGVLAGSLVGYLTQATTAQVTLIPAQHPVTLTTTLAVVTTGIGGSSGEQTILGRALPTMTLSQATTVPTSGTGHQDATSAHGLLTFYNGLPVEQTINAGTLITTSLGVQVVTEEDAVIPAASLPVSGHVTVSAHTLMVGPEGNLPALAVSMPCCRENVYVQNSSTFTGGQLARTFQSVSRQDISQARAWLTTSLQQSVQAAMQPQVHPGETLITPLPCQAKVSSDHAIGEEAAQVRVSLDDTCQGVVYQTQGMQQLLRPVLTQEVTHQLGTGSHLSSADVQSQVLHVQQQHSKGDTISMQVKATGIGIYQFTAEQMQHLKRVIAGKSRAEATRLLLAQPGVSTVSVEIKGRETETMPTEMSGIALLVITPAA